MPNNNKPNEINIKLPYDILIFIVSQLTLRERIRCTRVCKTWRSLLHSSAYMWRDISQCFIARDFPRYKINPDDIRHVFIMNQHDYTDIDYLVHLRCSKIQTLTNVHYRPCLERLLRITGSTLTHLQLVVINRNIQDTFYTIFSNCPQLKRLQYQNISPVRHLSTPGIPDTKLSTHHGVTKAIQQLQYLELSLPPIELYILKSYLVLFRGLKHLFLDRDPEDDGLLDWVDATFPLLHTLWINDAPVQHFYTRFVPSTKTMGGYKSLSYNSRYVNQECVERFINKYKRAPMIAFQCKMNPGFDDSRTFKWVKMYVHKLATIAHHLQSLVIENVELIQLGDDEQEQQEEEEEEEQGCGSLGLDLLLYYFPCLEQLALTRVAITNVSTSTIITNNGTAVITSSTLPSNNSNNTMPFYRKTLKTFSVVDCKGFTTDMLNTIMSERFQSHMKYIRIIGTNYSMDKVMSVLSKNVHALDRFEVHDIFLGNATVRMIIDTWIDKRLNYLRIVGGNQVISLRGLTSYARQKLKYTFVQIKSG